MPKGVPSTPTPDIVFYSSECKLTDRYDAEAV
jgi:hypothetical protein